MTAMCKNQCILTQVLCNLSSGVRTILVMTVCSCLYAMHFMCRLYIWPHSAETVADKQIRLIGLGIKTYKADKNA